MMPPNEGGWPWVLVLEHMDADGNSRGWKRVTKDADGDIATDILGVTEGFSANGGEGHS